jgi:hypothetical protein
MPVRSCKVLWHPLGFSGMVQWTVRSSFLLCLPHQALPQLQFGFARKLDVEVVWMGFSRRVFRGRCTKLLSSEVIGEMKDALASFKHRTPQIELPETVGSNSRFCVCCPLCGLVLYRCV